MKLLLNPEAREDLRELEKDLSIQISQAIDSLADNPLPENSYVIPLPDGTEIQCLKLQKEDRNSRLNHRITYDILENKYLRVYGIFKRSSGYKDIKQETARRKTN